jgi:hypothetical protein
MRKRLQDFKLPLTQVNQLGTISKLVTAFMVVVPKSVKGHVICRDTKIQMTELPSQPIS